jgi:hypothetical protein
MGYNARNDEIRDNVNAAARDLAINFGAVLTRTSFVLSP